MDEKGKNVPPYRISPIIPVLNEEKNMSRLIRLSKTFRDVEFIVVDGGSRDRTRHMIRKHPEIILLRSEKGRGHQLNQGATVAKGDILFFLHADARIPEDAFEEIRRIITSGAVGGAFRVKTEAEKNRVYRKMAVFLDIRSRFSRLPYGDQGIFCLRNIFERIGGFPEIPLFEDIGFSKKLVSFGRLVISKKKIVVSGRRLDEWGLFKTFVIMRGLWLAHILTIPPEKLAKWYRDIR